MARLLHIEASPRKQRSHSRKVAGALLDAYRKANPDDEVATLDLWSIDLPPFDGDMLDAKYAVLRGQEQSPAQVEAWREVTREFENFARADKFVLSVPMWNFGIPYRLKHYIDVITQPGLAFSFSPETGYTGLVTGKPAAVVYASGGSYAPGSGAEASDFQKPYVELWLRFIGFETLHALHAAPTLGAPDAVAAAEGSALAEAREIAAKL